jgi:hypothetical protein
MTEEQHGDPTKRSGPRPRPSGRYSSAMRAGPLLIVAAFVLGTVACSDADDDDDSTPASSASSQPERDDGAQRQPEGATSYFSIEEVGVGANSYVTLENITSEPVALDGLQLCHIEACAELVDVVVAGGDVARIALGDGAGLDKVVMTDAALEPFDPVDGEIALYSSSDESADSMLNYVQWGSDPHQRTADALEAGLWVEGGFAPTSASATRLYREADSGLWLFEPNP